MMKGFFFLAMSLYNVAVFSQVPLIGTIQQYNQKTHNQVESSWPAVEPQGLQEYKSQKVAVKKFDKRKWKTIVGKTDYSEKKLEQQQESRAITKPLNPWVSDVLRIVVYILLSAFILFVIYYVIKNTSLKGRKSIVPEARAEEPIENIEELDVDTLLQLAIKNGDFRMAVRLYYLAILKNLHERNIISWKKDKTNRDYLTEIFAKEYYNDLRVLTLAYEQAWYGEQPLSEDIFKKLVEDFHQFNQRLKATV